MGWFRVTVDSRQTLRTMLNRIRRPFTGVNGIFVRDSEHGVTIGLASYVGPPNTIGGGSGGASAYYTLEQAGGSPGSGTSACTFAYNLWPLGTAAFTDTTQRLATSLQPQPIHRDETGLYSQAPSGSIGEAVKVGSNWVLLTAFGERRLTQGCA